MAHISGRLRKHFIFRHFISKLEVFQEGRGLLPLCYFYGMHMPAGRIIRNRNTARFDSNTQMRWRRRGVTISDKCSEATFSLTGVDEAEHIEGVESSITLEE